MDGPTRFPRSATERCISVFIAQNIRSRFGADGESIESGRTGYDAGLIDVVTARCAIGVPTEIRNALTPVGTWPRSV